MNLFRVKCLKLAMNAIKLALLMTNYMLLVSHAFCQLSLLGAVNNTSLTGLGWDVGCAGRRMVGTGASSS